MGELVDALAASVREMGVQLRLASRVVSIARPEGAAVAGREDGFVVRVVDAEGRPDALAADAVVLASPAYAAADALRSLDADLARSLDEIPYVSTGTVSLAFERSAIPHPLDAVGLILPRGEQRRILAATFSSSKWEGRAPADHALLRVFFGGHRDPAAMALGDDDLVSVARDELASLLGVRRAPMFTSVFRYERSNPQPVVGHAARLDRLRARAAPGLYFAGAAFDGVGIPDCVRQANEVAARILGA
jgi:oxygen-dependent protoporphyrinogen oxidase